MTEPLTTTYFHFREKCHSCNKSIKHIKHKWCMLFTYEISVLGSAGAEKELFNIAVFLFTHISLERSSTINVFFFSFNVQKF